MFILFISCKHNNIANKIVKILQDCSQRTPGLNYCVYIQINSKINKESCISYRMFNLQNIFIVLNLKFMND